ncbi:MAG: hypothetical protein ACYC49_03030 [Ignavibacteriaceae bacterium]
MLPSVISKELAYRQAGYTTEISQGQFVFLGYSWDFSFDDLSRMRDSVEMTGVYFCHIEGVID